MIKFMRFFYISILFFFVFISNSFSEQVTKVKVTGSNRISLESIIVFGDIKMGNNYEPQDINLLIKKLYETNFFSNIKIKLSDGVLIIEVPNDKNNSNYLNGKNHIPHLSFFSIKSLKKLLIDNGFNIDFISTARKKRKFINHQLLNDSKLKSNFRSLKPIYFLYSFFRYGVLQDLLSIWNYYMNNNISHFLNSPDFTYGADRMIIRSIASKK